MAGFKDGSVDSWENNTEDEDTENAEAKTDAGADNTEPDQESTTVDRTSGDHPPSTMTGNPVQRLPWIHRRNSITDGRENTKQLHLQDSTVDFEREQQSEIETILGESVTKADLREAALLVGLTHVDEVAEQLQEWGYAFEELRQSATND